MERLGEYNEKRRFDRTPEPPGRPGAAEAKAEGGARPAAPSGGLLVIQKHRARRLHYDLRLALGGVLVSWAVPKGPSLDPRDRRLAVHVEDHPLEYRDFEGVIPSENYGAGEVIVWDRGTWTWTPTPGKTSARSAQEALERGKLDFTVASEKLAGRFVLVRTGAEKNWMLMKVKDDHARAGSDIESERPESVLTGRTIEELAASAPGEARWNSQVGLEVPTQRGALDLGALLGAEAALAKEAGLPRTAAPMVAARVAELPRAPRGGEWLAEIELEGVRALAWKEGESVRLASPGRGDVAPLFPEVARALARLPARALVLDLVIGVLDREGRTRRELVAPRLEAPDALSIERLAREQPAVAFAFDVLHVDGRDVRRVPVAARKRLVAALLPADDPCLRYLAHVEGQTADFLAVAREKGLHGIVVKRPGSRYVAGATRLWLSVPCPDGTAGVSRGTARRGAKPSRPRGRERTGSPSPARRPRPRRRGGEQ
jgi:bifunctional non-homologous end joining protein LigD